MSFQSNHKIHKKICVISIFIYVLYPCVAWSITLSQAIEKALKNDPALMACTSREKETEYAIKAEKHSFYPSLNFSSTIGWYNNEISTTQMWNSLNIPLETTKETIFRNMGVGFSWFIFKEKSFVGFHSSKLSALHEELNENRFQCELKKLEKIEEVMSLFLDIYKTKMEIDILNDELSFCKWIYKLVSEQCKLGLISKIDSDYVFLVLKQAQIDLKIRKNNLVLNKAKFANMLGIQANKLYLEMDDLSKYSIIPSFSIDDIYKLINNYPQLKLLEATKNQYFWEYKRNKDIHWPVLGLTGGLFWYDDEESASRQLSYILLTLSWSFDITTFDVSSQSYQEYVSYTYEYKALKNELIDETIENFRLLKENELQIKSLEYQIKWKKILKDKLKDQFKLGLIDAITLLDAEQELVSLQMQALDLRIDLINRIVKFKHLLGLKWNE